MSLASPSPGLGIVKYELCEEIGHGGMATVYRARDRRLDRDVALKVIHRHLRDNPDVRTRFASEALTVARVKHPNIVEVYDVSDETESERYLVVELIRGVTLRQLLAEVGPLPPEVAASIGFEVASALAHAHQHGVIHRDVKPENVLLSTEGARSGGPTAGPRVKLTDFGIAKLLDAQGVTHTGQVLGSPAHMAPEQIEGGDVDARSDVFGTGVLLYEMLTGTLPFEGKNPAQVLRRVLEGGSIPADRLRPEIGSTYGQIVSRSLEREPSARYATATELAMALNDELAGLGVSDPRLEIENFLDNRPGYLAEHGAKIVERLSSRAQARRNQGDVVGSSVDYNRALAYRPDDTILLAEVAGLMRRRRARKQVELGLWTVGLGLGLFGIAYVGRDALRATSQRGPTRPRTEVSAPGAAQPSQQATKVLPKEVRALPQVPNEPAAEPVRNVIARSPQKKPSPLTKPERPAEVGSRPVRTPIAGPQNARVRIDGELSSWFQVHQLSHGPHIFEFIPPNGECCEQPPPVTVEIVPGDGPQFVRGTISFKDAVLTFDGPLGARATCGAAGSIVAGSSKTIRMSRPEEHLVCTIFPAPGSGRETRRIDVDLRPGRTFTLVEQ